MRLDELPWNTLKDDMDVALVNLCSTFRLAVYRTCGGTMYDVYVDRMNRTREFTIADCETAVGTLEAQCLIYDYIARYSGGNDAPR